MSLFVAYEHISLSRREQERIELAGMLQNDVDARPPNSTNKREQSGAGDNDTNTSERLTTITIRGK